MLDVSWVCLSIYDLIYQNSHYSRSYIMRKQDFENLSLTEKSRPTMSKLSRKLRRFKHLFPTLK